MARRDIQIFIPLPEQGIFVSSAQKNSVFPVDCCCMFPILSYSECFKLLIILSDSSVSSLEKISLLVARSDRDY
jgi:hypothetical protein